MSEAPLLPLDPEPDRGANYYEWLKWWYRQPENQPKDVTASLRAAGERAREIERSYVIAMQKDKNLD